MHSDYFSDYIENAEYELKLLIPACIRGDLDIRRIHLLCDTFRQRGVCTFLLTDNPQPFHLNCMQSAGAYQHYLQNAPYEAKVTSQSKPFYDAVGCEFWDSAHKIALTSRMDWNPAKEYEEDFLFILFLLKFFFMNTEESECRQIITQHNQAAQGNDQVHRNICLAFLNHDSELFDKTLKNLLYIRAHRLEELIKREAIPKEHWVWLQPFSSEGLALVKLAERAGLQTNTNYPQVSESLRKAPLFNFDPEAWRKLTCKL